MKKWFLSLALASLALSAVQAQSTDEGWTATWATAVEFTGPGDMPKASLSNRSLREIIHISIGGETLRMQLSTSTVRNPLRSSPSSLPTPPKAAILIPSQQST